MASANTGVEGHYEARGEAAWVAITSAAVLVLLALVSLKEGWQLSTAVVDLARPRGAEPPPLRRPPGSARAGSGVADHRRRRARPAGRIVVGNVAGLRPADRCSHHDESDKIGGGQLLLTAAVIWLANISVFGVWYLGDRRRRPGSAGESRPQGRQAGLPVPAGRGPAAGPRRLDAAHLGLPLHLAHGRERVQPDGHDAADAEGEAARRASSRPSLS